MRLQVDDYGFDAQLPQNEEESTIENSAKMFSILSDAIYKDKILAVIRELSCNARDAMHDAGNNQPYRIKLPTSLDAVFRVEDDGVGINPSDMRKIYLTYGGSTKTEDENAIGALGLGSKSPFAYTKSSFIVKNRWYTAPSTEAVPQITEYTYFIFINKNGRPALSLVGAEPLYDGKKGITVELAVKPNDIDLFVEKTDQFYRYWTERRPAIIDYEESDVFTQTVEKVVEGRFWFLESDRPGDMHNGAIALMGNIPYPILVDSIPDMPDDLRLIAKNPFVITFPLGELAFQPSREDLSYDEFTVKNLIARMNTVRDEIATQTKKKLFAPGQTQLEFRRNFVETMLRLSLTLNTQGAVAWNFNFNQWACKFIFDKTLQNTVTYQGTKFKLENLFDSEVLIESGYEPYCVVSVVRRGKRNRLSLKNSTMVNVDVVKNIKYNTLFRDSPYIHDVKPGETYKFEWQSKVFNHAKDDLSGLQSAYLNEDYVSFSSTTLIKVWSDKVRFVINDAGSVGNDRFKAMIESPRNPLLHEDIFFVRFNPKETNAAEVASKVETLIVKGALVGSKVSFISDFEDFRAPIVKVQVPTGKIKLCSIEINSYSSVQETFSAGRFPHSETVKCNVTSCNLLDLKNIKMFDVDEMKKEGTWGYVIKNRSRKEVYDYDETMKDLRASIVGNKELLSLASHLGYLNGLVHESTARGTTYNVLVLNTWQIHWLKKNGVNVVSVRDHLAEKAKADRAAHDFVVDINTRVSMKTLNYVGKIYQMIKDDFENRISIIDGGILASVLRDFHAVESAGYSTIPYVKMHVYSKLVKAVLIDTAIAYNTNKTMNEMYPLLSCVAWEQIYRDHLKDLFDYIKMMDTRSIQIVKEQLL